MRRLWTDIVAPFQEVVVDMHRRGVRVDFEERERLLAKAEEEKNALEDTVLGTARGHVGGAMPPLPEVARCPRHPGFAGATPKNVRGSKRCDACVHIYGAMRDWRNSKSVKRAKRLAEFNPGSKAQVGWLLFEAIGLPVLERTEAGAPSVTLGVLEELQDRAFASTTKEAKIIRPHVGLLETLIELAHVQHRISVDLNPPIGSDGRAHPVYSIDFTSIARNRSGASKYDLDKQDETGFNFQNIPDEVRRIYVADEGHALLGADASQIEWVLTMLYARCRRAVEAYAKGFDIHTENAKDIVVPIIFEEVWDELTVAQKKGRRRTTKSFTHGLDYGEWIRNLSRRMKVPEAVAKRAHSAYFGKWPEIPVWQDETREDAIRDRALRTCFGRQRRFLDVTTAQRGGQRVLTLDRKQFKEALAFRPAATNADIQKIVARRLYDAGLQLLMATHDDHLMQVKVDRIDVMVPKVRELCEQGIEELAEWNDGVAWCPRFDVRVGSNAADWHGHDDECGGEECSKMENLEGLRKVA